MEGEFSIGDHVQVIAEDHPHFGEVGVITGATDVMYAGGEVRYYWLDMGTDNISVTADQISGSLPGVAAPVFRVGDTVVINMPGPWFDGDRGVVSHCSPPYTDIAGGAWQYEIMGIDKAQGGILYASEYELLASSAEYLRLIPELSDPDRVFTRSATNHLIDGGE